MKTSQNATKAPSDFFAAIDTSDVLDTYRAMRRRSIIMRIVTVILFIAGICVTCFPIVLQWQSNNRLSQISTTVAQHVAGWPYPNAENAFKEAQKYNAKLATTNQPILGESQDPFASSQGGTKARGEDSAAANDAKYQSLLDSGNGVMGTILIPKISVELPIYHGTSEEALASGAGHLYGTSLPVGGSSTHAVITGHRGLVSALMFTRLDEMRKGDFFYIEVMNEKLGYEVDSISVIEPDDDSKLRIRAGEDRVTLMTCTPYGINTQRLLVSGHRVEIPEPAPDPSDLHDARNIAVAVTAVMLVGGWLFVSLARRIGGPPRLMLQHAAAWPRNFPHDIMKTNGKH